MKVIFEAAIGCILALSLWRSTKENWLLATAQLVGFWLLLEYANRLPFPMDALVWVGAIFAYSVIEVVGPKYWEKLRAMYDKELAKAKAEKDNPA